MGALKDLRLVKVRSSDRGSTPPPRWREAPSAQTMASWSSLRRGKGDASARPLVLSATYIMRGLHGNHNWSHMSVFSLQQEAQSRAQTHGSFQRPHTTSEVHCVCWQGKRPLWHGDEPDMTSWTSISLSANAAQCLLASVVRGTMFFHIYLQTPGPFSIISSWEGIHWINCVRKRTLKKRKANVSFVRWPWGANHLNKSLNVKTF